MTTAPGIPGWAYRVSVGVPGPKGDGTVFHVPNSTIGMTLTRANLTLQDMLAIAAYVSSRSPEALRPTTTALR